MYSDTLFTTLGIASVLTIFALTAAFVIKTERVKKLKLDLTKLKKSLEEMDEQAKLIVRTDLELNKTQEELDKKVSGLYALQKVSRVIRTTLEETQIFASILRSHIEELGFEKAMAFLWDGKKKNFRLTRNIGYPEKESERILSQINSDKQFYLDLIEQEKTTSSISLNDLRKNEEIGGLFNVKHFAISALLPKEGDNGLIFLGTEAIDTIITEGDEELITILASEIGQALENARLFEKTWHAQQELEKKVIERTKELSEALEGIKAVSKRKTDFISAVSHELRTPLTSIKGYAAILLSEKLGQVPGPVKERLSKINRHSDELTHLVNDLLDISRIESGRVSMKQEEQNLKEVLEAISDLLGVQFKERNIDFKIDLSKDCEKIKADSQQIRRVFINLIGNAIKFTPEKGSITVRSSSADGFVQIDISDTGIGIPKEAINTVFEEFYRVDNEINQQVKGTGLGLPLVKHIVEAHKGNIWVKSNPGEGATFSFTLPKP